MARALPECGPLLFTGECFGYFAFRFAGVFPATLLPLAGAVFFVVVDFIEFDSPCFYFTCAYTQLATGFSTE